MLPIICIVFAVMGASHSSYVANQYIDTVLHSALQNELRMLALDPAPLPNFNTEFYDKVAIFGKVKGKANYTEGNLTGLARATRYSECQGPSFKFGASTINCTISFNQLQTSYKGTVKYGKLPTFNVKARANITNTLVFIEIAANPQNVPGLKTFQFQQLGQINPKFTGLGSLANKFLKVLEDGYKGHVNAELYNSISQRFQYALSNAAAKVPMPR